MSACDCCGKRVDERSMADVEGSDGVVYFVCQSCRGSYDDEELVEKIQQEALNG